MNTINSKIDEIYQSSFYRLPPFPRCRFREIKQTQENAEQNNDTYVLNSTQYQFRNNGEFE